MLPWPSEAERDRAAGVVAAFAAAADRQQRARTVIEFDAAGLAGGEPVEASAGDYRGGTVVCPVPVDVPSDPEELRAGCRRVVDHAVADRQRHVEEEIGELRQRFVAQLRGLRVDAELDDVDFADMHDVALVLNAVGPDALDALWVFSEQALAVNPNRAGRFARLALDALVATSAESYVLADRPAAP